MRSYPWQPDRLHQPLRTLLIIRLICLFSQVRLIKNAEEESVLAAVIDQPGTVVKLKYDGGLQGAAFLIFSNGQDQKLINGLVEQDASLGQTGETQEAIFNEIGVIFCGLSSSFINGYFAAYSPMICRVLSELKPSTRMISESFHEKFCFISDSIQPPMYFSSL